MSAISVSRAAPRVYTHLMGAALAPASFTPTPPASDARGAASRVEAPEEKAAPMAIKGAAAADPSPTPQGSVHGVIA